MMMRGHPVSTGSEAEGMGIAGPGGDRAAVRPRPVLLFRSLTLPVLTGAGAGFVVALVFRGFESWSNSRDAAKKSPLRYLNRLQENGVSFSISR